MLRFLLRLFVLLLLPVAGWGQQDSLYEIKGLPTKQVYDLMFDSKGFLWIGHEFGLSRYDGNKFTHFSSPLQNSLAVSNIVEDKKGRIWCRNFTSQVFYVEKNKMNLLTQYQFKEERRFPSMVILNNKLIANSNKGIFVMDLENFSVKNIRCGKQELSSIAVWKDKIIAYSQQDLQFFFFDPASADSTARPVPIDKHLDRMDDFVLQNFSFYDTIYAFSSKMRTLTKLVYTDGMIRLKGNVKGLGFLNTINPSPSQLWLHTSVQSFPFGGKEIIRGHNLSDLVKDKEGNTWVSSLNEGIMVKYQNTWQLLNLKFLQPSEVIQKGDNHGRYSVYATNRNNIYVTDEVTGITKKVKIPEEEGQVQFIRITQSGRVVISVKLHFYVLTLPDMVLITPLKNFYFFSAKSAVEFDSAIYTATANGLFKILARPDKYGNDFSAVIIKDMRSRWIEYNPLTRQMLIAFKDGVEEFMQNKLVPVKYNNKDIAAVCMLAVKDQIFISTFNSDILMVKGSRVIKLPLHKETRPVFKMISRNDTVWMLGADYIRVLKSGASTLQETILIPRFPDAAMYDIAFVKDQICLLTSKGAFVMSRWEQTKPSLVNFITEFSVNGKAYDIQDELKLAPFHNNIEISLASPLYTNPEKLYYKYRLSRNDNDKWIESEYGQNKFVFSSLQKGQYRFEALAVHSQFGQAVRPVTVTFTIKPVWFETTAFKILFSFLIASAVILPMAMFFRYRLRQQKLNYEKQLAVQLERERISEEIHDDIGAGLSGLRLYTELVSNKLDNPESKGSMNRIYSSITELSSKMQDVIWSLNARNDSLENLLRYIQKQSFKLFGNSTIKLVMELPADIPHIQLLSDTRADIYLAVKEGLHNVLKHSGATLVNVDFLIQKRQLLIQITDNGNGYTEPVQPGNGMLNMQKRMQRVGGTMKIKAENGVNLQFLVPLDPDRKKLPR